MPRAGTPTGGVPGVDGVVEDIPGGYDAARGHGE